MRLSTGEVWTIPIYLDVSSETVRLPSANVSHSRLQVKKHAICKGSRICLRDPRDDSPLAIMTVQDVYKADKHKEAVAVYGADDSAHPGVEYLHSTVQDVYIGGRLQAIQLPSHYDYPAIRCKSSETHCYIIIILFVQLHLKN